MHVGMGLVHTKVKFGCLVDQTRQQRRRIDHSINIYPNDINKTYT